ncbi:MAG TPA: tautomerase family protein [Pseudonocardia sp.]|jgi:phenylpyruvate tautomerase PptA (4-oxalocrotonate tautomerase family)
MPIVTFHLVQDAYPPDRLGQLLARASTMYSRVLDSPIQRVRAFVAGYRPEHAAVAGQLVGEGARPAPYFEFLVLAGRPAGQRHELLAGFTDLIVEVLDAPRELVRGRAVELDPDNWAIGGTPASVRRATEIDARATAAGS